MKHFDYLLALHAIEGLGSVRLQLLLQYFGDPKLAWEANPQEWSAVKIPKPVIENFKTNRPRFDLEQYLKTIEEAQIKIISLFDDTYPDLLKQIPDPPLLIYYQGDISITNKRAMAIVGTRKVTGYGKLVTEQFTHALVAAGFVINSGLARGVDTLAHQVTLQSGGQTIAVLGAGLQHIYPAENETLFHQIVEAGGLVLSEHPPQYPVSAGVFPARNRIISGLSLGVLVTEAAEDSGSLITARLAIDQGREVFAIPGPITSGLSKGPANLIQQGAKLVYEVGDILEELGMERMQSAELRVENFDLSSLTEIERKILGCLEFESKHVDEICRELRKTAAEVSGTLVKMEIQGYIKNLGQGSYLRLI